MAILLQQIVSGLALGCVYGLIALGYSLVYNAVGLVNMAQGSFVMVGAFIYGVTLTNKLNLPFWASLPLLVLSMGVFGMVCERLFYRPFKRAHVRTMLVSLVALGMLLGNLALIVWGPYPQGTKGLFGQANLRIGEVSIFYQSLFIIVVTAALLILQWWLFKKTTVGKVMRAVALDKNTSDLMGIESDLAIALTFAYTAVLGGIAGMLLAPFYSIDPSMQNIGFKGFGASVIGSFSNTPGAMVGGLLLGLIETFGAAYVSSLYKDTIAFVVIIAFLLFRPEGLLGKKSEESGL